jgi:ABC-2 type transport system permease protein
MLWKKSWWDTRWLFLAGLVATLVMFGWALGWGNYDATDWTARLQRMESLSESDRHALNNYQGHVWALWVKLLFNFIWADFAVALGAMCLMSACPWTSYQKAAGLFTFSLPASRRKVLLAPAAVGFIELFLIGLIPSLLLPVIALFHGRRFSLGDALIYAVLLIFGGAVLFCFAFLVTVISSNYIMSFVLIEIIIIALYLTSLSFAPRPRWNILGVMAGESYFFHGRIPWLGLAISLILSAVFLFAAVRIYERRDL